MNQVKNKIISKTTRDKLLKRIMNNYIYIQLLVFDCINTCVFYTIELLMNVKNPVQWFICTCHKLNHSQQN